MASTTQTHTPNLRKHLPPQQQLSTNTTSPTPQQKLNSYYADKNLAWWLELARDFKRARNVPLPDDEEDAEI